MTSKRVLLYRKLVYLGAALVVHGVTSVLELERAKLI